MRELDWGARIEKRPSKVALVEQLVLVKEKTELRRSWESARVRYRESGTQQIEALLLGETLNGLSQIPPIPPKESC